MDFAKATEQQYDRIIGYYQWQSKIYDLTRWAFLFGRKKILKKLPFEKEASFQLLEVGCGTGHNLSGLRSLYPNAQLKGIDLSEKMLSIAAQKFQGTEGNNIQLYHQAYRIDEYDWSGKLDVILFSYALTMINPQWKELITQAYKDLCPGGYIAVVDFHDSSWPVFKKHMAGHHVRMDSHLLPHLKDTFDTELSEVNSAYGGIWQYAIYLGRK